MPTPTLAQLKAEIESGPLAADLATAWATVFPTEDEPEAGTPAHARWERVRDRFGTLTPDAVADILRVLGDGTKRSKPFPMAVATFTQFLASRSLLRRIKSAVNDSGLPDAVRDICDLIVTLTQSAPDRVVDPTDAAVDGMMAALVAAAVVTAEDTTAFVAACTKPCSRLVELGWQVSAESVRLAKGA